MSKNAELQHILTVFQSLGYTNPTMTRHSMCLHYPSPWILDPLSPPARNPFFGKLTSQEQTSWLIRAVFIVGVNNNHLRYDLALENHLQVLSTPFIVCE